MICISNTGVLRIVDGPDCSFDGISEQTIEIVEDWKSLS